MYGVQYVVGGGLPAGEIAARVEKYVKLLDPATLAQFTVTAAQTLPGVFELLSQTANSNAVFRKIFVRGLSFSTTEQTLRGVFEQYGDLIECSVTLDRQTGQSRGFGFVTFRDLAGAEACLKVKTLELDVRILFCPPSCIQYEYFCVNSRRSATYTYTHTYMHQGRRINWALAAMPDTGAAAGGVGGSAPPPSAGSSSFKAGGVSNESVDARKLFIRSLASHTTSATLRDQFIQYGEIEDCAVITDKATGQSK
jgi:RNA recognition motif. (a.k.a. RRM, RBD, or RNP domain)